MNLPRSLAMEIEHLWKKVKVPRWSRRSCVDGQTGELLKGAWNVLSKRKLNSITFF